MERETKGDSKQEEKNGEENKIVADTSGKYGELYVENRAAVKEEQGEMERDG